MMSAPSKMPAALFAALVANAVGLSFIQVVLPPLGRGLGFTDLQTGSLVSLSALAAMVSAPVWGYASERLGRRFVLLAGLAAAALALLGVALVVSARFGGQFTVAVTLALMFALRLGQASLSAGVLPAAQALVADLTDFAGRARGMGLLGASYGVGAIAGAALAWRMGASVVEAFCLAAGAAALGFALVAARVREPQERRSIRNQSGDLRLAGLWPHLGVTLAALAAYSTVQQVTGLRLQDALGYSGPQAIAGAGRILMTAALTMACAQAFVIRRIDWPPRRLMRASALVGLSAMAVLTRDCGYFPLLAATAVFAGALGLLLPGNLAAMSQKAETGAQGKTAGINAMFQGFGFVAGPWIGARLQQIGPTAPYVGATALLALVCIFTFCAAPDPVTAKPQEETT